MVVDYFLGDLVVWCGGGGSGSGLFFGNLGVWLGGNGLGCAWIGGGGSALCG